MRTIRFVAAIFRRLTDWIRWDLEGWCPSCPTKAGCNEIRKCLRITYSLEPHEEAITPLDKPSPKD